MAAGLIGLVSGGVLGYAGAQHRAKLQQEQAAKDFAMKAQMEALEKDPSGWTEDFQKQAKKQWGEETFNNLKPTFDMMAASHARKKAADEAALAPIMKMLSGGMSVPPTAPTGPTSGGVSFTAPSPSGQGQPAAPATAPTTGAAAAASPTAAAAPATPDYAGQIRNLIAARLAVSSHEFADPKEGDRIGKTIDDEMKLAFEQMKAAAQTPEAKAEVARAEAEAKLKVNYSPEAIAGAAKKSGAEAVAGESARLNVEFSPANVRRKISAAVEEAKQKAEAAGKTPAQARAVVAAARLEANSRITRLKGLNDMYAKDHPQPLGASTGFRDLTAWRADRDAFIQSHGIDPATGADLNAPAEAAGAATDPAVASYADKYFKK